MNRFELNQILSQPQKIVPLACLNLLNFFLVLISSAVSLNPFYISYLENDLGAHELKNCQIHRF